MPTIECITHGSLEDYLPSGTRGNRVLLEFETTPSVNDILDRIDIDRDLLQFVLADGCYVELHHWHEPAEGEVFQLWPRISGG